MRELKINKNGTTLLLFSGINGQQKNNSDYLKHGNERIKKFKSTLIFIVFTIDKRLCLFFSKLFTFHFSSLISTHVHSACNVLDFFLRIIRNYFVFYGLSSVTTNYECFVHTKKIFFLVQ